MVRKKTYRILYLKNGGRKVEISINCVDILNASMYAHNTLSDEEFNTIYMIISKEPNKIG